LGFFLGLPSPVAVEVKQIMIGSSPWPWFKMFYGLGVWLQLSVHFLVVPHGIPVAAVRIDTGVHDDQVILQPGLRLLVGRINQSPKGHHGCLRRYRLIAMDVVRSEEHTSELQSRENLVC